MLSRPDAGWNVEVENAAPWPATSEGAGKCDDEDDGGQFLRGAAASLAVDSAVMFDVTRLLDAAAAGDPHAAAELLPLVYDELRKLAAARMATEQPGQTLQATALVHEAYLRLVDGKQVQNWNSRRHFF